MSDTEKKEQFIPASPSSKSESTPAPVHHSPSVATEKSTSGMAIAGLIASFFIPLLGLIFSIIGLSQTKDNKRGGRGLAIAGLIISIIGMLLGLLWLVIFIVAIANSDDISSSNPASNSSLSSLSDTKPALIKAKIGEPARDGKFEFTVKSFECGKTTVGDQYYSVTAQGEFCMVNIKVANIGDEPQSMFSSNQYMFNAEGQKFSADSSATSAVDTSNDLWLKDINPGNSIEGTVVYDVPKGMRPTVVELHDSYFSDGVSVELK